MELVLLAETVLLLHQQELIRDQADFAMMRSLCSSEISDMQLHLVMVLGRSEEKRREKTISMLTAAREDSRPLVL